jgi:prepilin-type N-terminal cleavage/methylation domain-containing protein/prepilin-type processing-associated H-X9-DG protein
MLLKTRRAFTLVELLVVIAIIAMLLSILMPTLGKVKEQARKIVCGNNIRQCILGLSIYANNYNGRLPINTFNGWLWDVGDPTILALIKNSGCTAKTFYCPSNVPFTNAALDKDRNYWDLNAIAASANSANPGYRITGYCWLMDAQWGNPVQTRGKVYADATLPADAFPNFWPSTVYCKKASTVELVTDMTESDGISPKYPNGKFTNIVCGYTSRTNHLAQGKVDRGAGGNMGFVDGHVAWRNFVDMKKRLPTVRPYFWW